MSSNRPPAVEICAYSLESCQHAKAAGADRLELCASLYEGGTTPPMGLLRLVRAQVGLGVHVMIRPRGGDFCYSEREFAVMQAEIEAVRQVAAEGVVLGILLPDGRVDVPRTRQLVEAAYPLPVTFHRAFDFTRDADEALDAVLETGCRRLLTSGGANTAPEGMEQLARCVRRAAGRIEIMAGSGVNAENAAALLATGVGALHLSARGTRPSAMQFRKAGIALGGLPAVPEYEVAFSEVEKIRAVVEIARRYRSETRIG